jgi:hypothetical protein
MPETFLILFAGGILLATAISRPDSVTPQWLRLGGILGLTMLGLSIAFQIREPTDRSASIWICDGLTAIFILSQLGFCQSGRLSLQRYAAAAAGAAAMAAAMALPRPGAAAGWIAIGFVGVAAMTGLVLMEMLLGHAYLTAAKMSMQPMQRLNHWMAAALAFRAVTSIGVCFALQLWRPIEMLWVRYGLQIGTRWLVGLAVPGVFVYMTHDCIKRRATQSATGILYVAGVLVLVGELIGLFLARETGRPF